MAIRLDNVTWASYVEISSTGRPSAMSIFDSFVVEPDAPSMLGFFILAWLSGLTPGTEQFDARWEISRPNDPNERILLWEGPVHLVTPVSESGRCYVSSGGILLPPTHEWSPAITHVTAWLTIADCELSAEIPVLRAARGG